MSEATREAPPPLREDAGPAFDGERDRVLALVNQVNNALSLSARAGAADALRHHLDALPGAWPKESVHQLLEQLLADVSLGEVLDSNGDPLRRALVAANQRLGFPFALGIDPADLQHLAKRPGFGGSALSARVLTGLAAAVSLFWNGAWVEAMFSSGSHLHLDNVPLAVLFSVAAAHAVLTLYAVATARKGQTRLLRWLGKAAAIGPIGSLLFTFIDDDFNKKVIVFCAGLIAATPAMFTAGLCWWTANRLDAKR